MFLIVDGSSLIHRAFYALPPMSSPAGEPTNAVYGFFSMLFSVCDKYAPDHICVAFDRKEKTFRHQRYDAYKAGRRPAPDDLNSQFALLKSTLARVGIKVYDRAGYEADDILGTLCTRASQTGMKSCLLSGDKDILQLTDENVTVLLTRKGVSDLEVFDKAHFGEVYEGLVPARMIDLKALMGDSSDNIPGVPGVGEKTALKLLGQYATLDGIYENIDSMPKNKLHEKLADNKESAYFSYMLATIERDMPLEEKIEDFAFGGFDENGLSESFSELGFASLLKRRGIQEYRPQAEVSNVDSEKELKELTDNLAKREKIAFVHKEGVLCLAADGKKEWRAEATPENIEIIRPLLENANVKKYVCGLKDMMHAGLLQDAEHDAMIAAYCIDPTLRDFSLEKLCRMADLPEGAAGLYALCGRQCEKIEEEGLQKIFYDIEMPLVRVLYDMEKEGFRVDTDELKRLGEVYDERIQALTAQIYELCGEEFNIGSTKQLGVILFEKLGLPVIKKKKTGYSTDIEVLEKLADKHPVIELLMEYRQVTKLKSTYIDGLLSAASPETSKVYTTFNQTATATGRISSNEPNLQNIPIRQRDEIRKVFIPSREGNVLVCADYSQIELRVLAAVAQDEHMTDAFLSGEDVHARTAAEVFGVPLSEVTHEMRSAAKAVNFGIVYGISDFGLAKQLGIPRFKAAGYIERYLTEFSGVSAYMRNIVAKAKEEGCVRTLWGRVRYIRELASTNYNMRSFGERAAMNTPIQGTAADIIKYAMICVVKELEKQKLSAKLILQVHDELIVDAPQDEAEAVKEILRRCMENAAVLAVPLTVNVGVGDNWAVAK